jgi:hypothetical protein
MDGQPVGEAFGDTFLGPRAFVERDQRQAGLVIQRAGEAGGKARLGTFGHGQDRTPGRSRRPEVRVTVPPPSVAARSMPPKSASSPISGWRRETVLPRTARSKPLKEPVPHRPHAGAEPDAAQCCRVERETGERQVRALPAFFGVGGVAHARTSSTVRVTRVVEPGLVQRIAAEAVAQRGGCHGAQMRAGHGGASSKAASARAARRSVSSPRNPSEPRPRKASRNRAGSRRRHPRGQGRHGPSTMRARSAMSSSCQSARNAAFVPVIGVAAADHVDAHLDVLGADHLDRQAEPVQKLRAKLPFLRVAGADEDEARGMADRQALTLHHVLTRLGDVEQQVDKVILQQVDLVDIEVAPVGRASSPGSNAFSPWDSAFSMSSAPTTRSSVAPSGRSMTGVGFSTTEWSCTCAQSGMSFSARSSPGSPPRPGSAAAGRQARARRWICRCPGRRTPERRRCRGRWRSGSWRVSSRPGPRWRRTGMARSVLSRSFCGYLIGSCTCRSGRCVRSGVTPSHCPSAASTRKRA